jgi:spore germination protein GerM
VRTVVLRVVGLAALLLLVLAAVLTIQTLRRLPDTIVYFVSDEGDYFRLEPVGRRSNGRTREQRARAAVAQLAAGPTASERARGLSSAVPEGTIVRDVILAERILLIDLSSEFESGGGSAGMQGRLYQLFYTLSQPGSVDGVELMVDGRPVFAFGGEGILVDSPWLRSEHPVLPRW